MAEPIELLSAAQRAEAIAVFWSSFVGPVPDPPPPGAAFATRRFVAAAIRLTCQAYGSAKDARWYGLAADGHLVSAALVTDARAQLTPRSYCVMVRYGLEMAWRLGWHDLREMKREVQTWPPELQKAMVAAFSPRPGFQELHLIATAPTVQGLGYGDRLLTFLQAEGKAHGYSGLVLTTMPQLPAYRWYLRHGFVNEVQFSLSDTSVCRMALSYAGPTKSHWGV